MEQKFLEVKNLHVKYESFDMTTYAVNGVSFSLEKGKTLGIVGETGAGKTTIAYSIMQILPPKTGKIYEGEILLDGKNILSMSEKEKRALRGNKIGLIFQDPMTALNPVMTVGYQIDEVLKIHGERDKKVREQKVDEMLELVGIPASRKSQYPHEFSGGMKQRIIIAIALSCNPELLIADEPTTALDVTIQAQVLALMNELKKKSNTSMIFITHDLGLIARMCDEVAVCYAGEIIEMGTTKQIFTQCQHPYTKGLFGSIPSLVQKVRRLSPIDGLMPDPTILTNGCKFCPRCTLAADKCRESAPDGRVVDGHLIKCHSV